MSLLVHVFLLWCKLVCANSFANCPLFGNLGFWSNVSVVICYGLFGHIFEVKKNCRMKNFLRKVALLWERNDVSIITAHRHWYLSVQPKPTSCWCEGGLWGMLMCRRSLENIWVCFSKTRIWWVSILGNLSLDSLFEMISKLNRNC